MALLCGVRAVLRAPGSGCLSKTGTGKTGPLDNETTNISWFPCEPPLPNGAGLGAALLFPAGGVRRAS